MSEAYASGHVGGEGGRPAAAWALSNAAGWLCLAAAPTFLGMALLTGLHGGDPADLFCSATQHASPLSGMAPMYLLMSAFHSPPWLKLIASRSRRPRRT